MIATLLTQTVNPDHLSLRAATCTQPISVCLSQQLHHPCRPASLLLQRLHSCPPLRASQATSVPTAVTLPDDTSPAAAGNAPLVKAAFAEAGLSQDAIDYILTQYPYYLRWDVEQKLLPAMQSKQQKLGARFPSEFRRIPKMLLSSTEVWAKAQVARKAAKVKAASENAMRVKAAFAQAGLSQDTIMHILTRYPHYLGWNVEQKLLPTMQCWQQELDDRFVAEFERLPRLLVLRLEKEQLKDQYLASIGVRSPKTLRKKSSSAFQQSLHAMQGKVAFLRSCGFSEVQVLSLVEQHPHILARSFKQIAEVLRVIGDVLECAGDMDRQVEAMLSCVHHPLLFSLPTATLCHNFSSFCTLIAVSEKIRKRAWKCGVFTTSSAELDIRLKSIAAQLDCSLHEAKSVVRSMPQISKLLPETVGLHVMQLLDLGFSHAQVKSMCLRQPVLLIYNFSSDVHVEKWGFLTCVLQLSYDAIAAYPTLLMSSLPNRLGPRWEYLQHLRLHGLIVFTAAPQVFQSLLFMTDSNFRAAYTAPQLRLYDERFQKQ